MTASGRLALRAIVVFASVVLLLAGLAAPALASHEVDFAITGFGDQDCRSGSGRLVNNTAAPFTVEICVTLDGSPLPDHPMTVEITHGDGTNESIDITTDTEGKATVRIEPKAAGTTKVEVCDADGCVYGSVEMSASNPPRPPAVASYLGPSTDMGPSEEVADGEDDFTDAYTGGPAEESPGEGFRPFDIASVRYLGVVDGEARFEITTRGDICDVFTEGAPFAQLEVRIEGEGFSYVLAYRYSSLGEDLTDARSDGARLEGVSLVLDACVRDSVAVLKARGVDVPSGSRIKVSTWLSRDPLSSGYWDDAEGVLVPAAPEPVSTTEAAPPTSAASGGSTATTGAPDDATDEPTDAPTETTLPGGGNTEGGSFSIAIPIIILGLAVGTFIVYYRTRERKKKPTGPGDGGDDDDGDDPRDTPPPVAYGEEMEHRGCGWALYWIDALGGRVTLREPGGVVHICCKYFIHIKTNANSSMLKSIRQDGNDGRLRLYDAGRDLADVRMEARAGTRSGPADSLGWMQGLGDPTDQSGIEIGEFRQIAPGDERPEVVAMIQHSEETTIAVTLESECPEYDHKYALEGSTDLQLEASHECTNDAGDPCPVELLSMGRSSGRIHGPGRFHTAIDHDFGGSFDDMDREPAGGQRVDHDHVEKDRVAHTFADHQDTNEVWDRPHLNILVENFVLFDTGQIVPEEVWPTTERVSVRAETMVNHEVVVDASLEPKGCEANGCCGHGRCDCKAAFQVNVGRKGSSVVVEGKVFDIARDPKPIGEHEWETWKLKKRP